MVVGNENLKIITAQNVGITSLPFVFLHLQNLTLQLHGVTPDLASLARCDDSVLKKCLYPIYSPGSNL